MKVKEILMLPMQDNDADAATIGDYLQALLLGMWTVGEGFSGKRPFGNSGWEHELYIPLVKAGLVKGEIDEEYGDLLDVDQRAAHILISDVIIGLFEGDKE